MARRYVATGSFKAHFLTKSEYGVDPVVRHNPPLLFHLGHDPSEMFNVAAQNSRVVADIQAIAAQHIRDRTVAPSQLDL